MDKIYFLVKHADEALHDLQLLLDDQDLFGSMRGTTIPEWEEEFNEVFGETNTERNDELLRYESFFILFFDKSNRSCYFVSVMMTIKINSHLGMLFYLLGISKRIGWSMHMQ